MAAQAGGSEGQKARLVQLHSSGVQGGQEEGGTARCGVHLRAGAGGPVSTSAGCA